MSPPSGHTPREAAREPDRACCAVGLTGGLASGKSTVARILGDSGVPVLDADAVVHRLYEPGGDGARAVADLFGAEVMNRAGGVDRAALRRLVLTVPEARRRLEGRIHPLVRDEIDRWLRGIPPRVPAVVEAALMVETGSWRTYDVVMVVWCTPEQQVARARRRGLPPDRIRALLDAQLPLEAKRTYADVVVDNTGDLEDLLSEVGRAWNEVTARCATAAPDQSAGGSSHSVV